MFLLGFVFANVIEWFVHKYLFHGWGKKKNSIFAFHLREHHKNCLHNHNKDGKYTFREFVGIVFLLFITFPLFFVSAPFYYGMVLYGALFLIVHNFVHKQVKWGRILFPWHWEHHMKYPHHNMNVVIPITDHILKTRKKFDSQA